MAAPSSLLSHSLAYLLVRAAGGVIALTSLAVLTRLLPPAAYGMFALAAALSNSGAALLFQWVCVGVNRFHAAYRDDDGHARVLVRSAHWMYGALVVGVALLALAVTLLGLAMPLPWPPLLTVAVALALLGMALFNLHLQIGNARGDPLRYGLLSVLRAGLALGTAALLIAAGLGAPGAVLGLAIGAFAAVAIARADRSRGARQDVQTEVDADTLRIVRRRLVNYGTPLALAAAATMVVDISDRFLIGALRGAAEVAPYAAAYDLTQQTIGMLLNVLFLAGYPAVTRAWEQGGPAAARSALEPMARTVLLAAPLLLLLAAAFAPTVCGLMFGAAFAASSAQIMPWVALAVCLAGWRSFVVDVAFQLTGRTRTMLGITLAMAVLNVVLNLLLIPRFGALASACSAAAAFGFGAAASAWFARAMGVLPRVRGAVAPVALCAALAALPWWLGLDINARPLAAAGWALTMAAVYAASALALDACGCRSWLRARRRQTVGAA